jgi:hypothetical protein
MSSKGVLEEGKSIRKNMNLTRIMKNMGVL